MAAKPDQPASTKGNPVTVLIHVGPAGGTQPPSVRLATTVGSSETVGTLNQSGKTVPGTVLIGLPNSKVTGNKVVDGTKSGGSSATITPARRMVTRSIGKEQQKESSKSRKRKHSKGSDVSAPPKQDKGAKKGQIGPVVKLEKLKVPSSGKITLDSQKKNVAPKKSVAPKQVLPKMKAGDGFKVGDVKVTHTPSKSSKKRKAREDHTYTHTCGYYMRNLEEINHIKEKLHRDEKDVKRLKRNQKKLRMQVFRGNLKHRILKKTLLLEQKLHKEAKQTLKAITQGLQIQLAPVDPGA